MLSIYAHRETSVDRRVQKCRTKTVVFACCFSLSHAKGAPQHLDGVFRKAVYNGNNVMAPMVSGAKRRHSACDGKST